MLKEILKKHIKSQASYVEYGFGQVEPNHLSAQRTAQIYAQLPAAPAINILEQGQFVKYDYAEGLVNFTGAGEWMLVYNEIKLYREHQIDCEFAMIKSNYQARVYSPLDGDRDAEEMYGPTRLLQGKREKWDDAKKEFVKLGEIGFDKDGNPVVEDAVNVADYSVASTTYDYYEMNDVNNPDIEEAYRQRLFMKLRAVKHPEAMMPADTTMVPRVFKTNVGDIFTTNMINTDTELKVGQLLCIGTNGILCPEEKANAEKVEADLANGIHATAKSGDMRWQVVKVYTMPDHQKGVKIMRIA